MFTLSRTSIKLLAFVMALAVIVTACAPVATPAEAPKAAPAQPEAASTSAPAPTQAPAQPEQKPAATGEVVTVKYWHSMSQPETDQLAQVIAAFEKANPNIKIASTRYPPDDQSFKPALLTAVAGDELPDAARIDIVWVPQFADLGVLQQLDGWLPDFDTIAKAVFPGPLSTNLFKGHYYGLPLNTNTQVLLWNKSLFEAAGIKAPPKTLADFADVACKLSDKAKEQYGYAMGGTYFWAPAPVFYAMGGQIVDDKVSTATGYVNGPQSVAAFKMLKDLYDKGCLSPNLLGGGMGTEAGHGSGKYAMIIDGPWMKDIFKQSYPDFQVNFAPIPAGPDGKTSSVVGGEDVVIFEGSKVKDAAAKWVSFLMGPEAQKMMAAVGVMPTLASLTGDASLPAHFAVFMEQLKTAQARVPHPKWQEMDDAIKNAYQRMLRGDQTVQQALDQAAKEIDALLK